MLRDGRSTWLPAAAALALGLAACAAEPPAPASSGRHGGTLRLEAPQLVHVQSLDPPRVTDINSSSVAGAIYEGLLGYDPQEPTRLVPALAVSWNSSPDGRTWTFRLRDDAYFHDDPCFERGRGRAMTSMDVVHSLSRFLREAPDAPVSLRRFVTGAEAFARGDAGRVKGIEAPDQRTVRFHLERPGNGFLHALASSAGWVAPPEAIERYGAAFGRHPVGTGPFRFSSWNSTSLVLVRHEHYWKTDDEGSRLPYVDVLLFARGGGPPRDLLSDILEGDLHLLYFTGELDWHGSQDLSEFLSERGVRTVRMPKLNTIFLGFQMAREGPWSRVPELRRAISLAVRRPEPGDLLLPARGLVPPGLCPGPPPEAAPHDLERARALLAEAGYPEARRLPPLRFGMLGHSAFLSRAVIEPLEELGIELRPVPAPWEVHWEALDRGEYEFFRDGWIADYAGAENFLELFESGSAANHTRYSNPVYDELLERLRDLPPDDPERGRLCRRMEEILRSDAPAVFLYHEQSFYLVSGRVRGIEPSINPFERKFYELVWLEEPAS